MSAVGDAGVVDLLAVQAQEVGVVSDDDSPGGACVRQNLMIGPAEQASLVDSKHLNPSLTQRLRYRVREMLIELEPHAIRWLSGAVSPATRWGTADDTPPRRPHLPLCDVRSRHGDPNSTPARHTRRRA